MTDYYFSFGQKHRHMIGEEIFDKDVIVKIRAKNAIDARKTMFHCFGSKWGFMYFELPDMSLFPRGVIHLREKK